MAVQAPARGSAAGLGIAAACFIGWGLMPFYFKALVHVDPVEVVAHRIVWSALFLACLLPFGGRMEELGACRRARALCLRWRSQPA